jgi:hypothetical protein
MRVEDFPATSRGEAREVPGQGYVAYYPASVPRRVDYTDRLVSQLDEATGALHRLAESAVSSPTPTSSSRPM